MKVNEIYVTKNEVVSYAGGPTPVTVEREVYVTQQARAAEYITIERQNEIYITASGAAPHTVERFATIEINATPVTVDRIQYVTNAPAASVTVERVNEVYVTAPGALPITIEHYNTVERLNEVYVTKNEKSEVYLTQIERMAGATPVTVDRQVFVTKAAEVPVTVERYNEVYVTALGAAPVTIERIATVDNVIYVTKEVGFTKNVVQENGVYIPTTVFHSVEVPVTVAREAVVTQNVEVERFVTVAGVATPVATTVTEAVEFTVTAPAPCNVINKNKEVYQTVYESHNVEVFHTEYLVNGEVAVQTATEFKEVAVVQTVTAAAPVQTVYENHSVEIFHTVSEANGKVIVQTTTEVQQVPVLQTVAATCGPMPEQLYITKEIEVGHTSFVNGVEKVVKVAEVTSVPAQVVTATVEGVAKAVIATVEIPASITQSVVQILTAPPEIITHANKARQTLPPVVQTHTMAVEVPGPAVSIPYSGSRNKGKAGGQITQISDGQIQGPQLKGQGYTPSQAEVSVSEQIPSERQYVKYVQNFFMDTPLEGYIDNALFVGGNTAAILEEMDMPSYEDFIKEVEFSRKAVMLPNGKFSFSPNTMIEE